MVFCISSISFSVGAVNREASSEIYESNIININDPRVSVSEPMTLEEMATRYAANGNISYQDAYELLGGNTAEAQLDGARSYERRIFSVGLDVDPSYKPHIDFYCVTAEGGHFFQIDSIYSVQLVRSYQNISKQFSGDLEVWLRSSYDIEYIINGDFYNNGTTTTSLGGSAGTTIDGLPISLTFNCNFSYSSNHFKYFYDNGTFHWGA